MYTMAAIRYIVDQYHPAFIFEDTKEIAGNCPFIYCATWVMGHAKPKIVFVGLGAYAWLLIIYVMCNVKIYNCTATLYIIRRTLCTQILCLYIHRTLIRGIERANTTSTPVFLVLHFRHSVSAFHFGRRSNRWTDQFNKQWWHKHTETLLTILAWSKYDTKSVDI